MVYYIQVKLLELKKKKSCLKTKASIWKPTFNILFPSDALKKESLPIIPSVGKNVKPLELFAGGSIYVGAITLKKILMVSIM